MNSLSARFLASTDACGITEIDRSRSVCRVDKIVTVLFAAFVIVKSNVSLINSRVMIVFDNGVMQVRTIGSGLEQTLW